MQPLFILQSTTTVLILLTVFFYFRLERLFAKALSLMQGESRRLRCELERLSEDTAKLKCQNKSLEEAAEGTLALYDLTTEICKHLDEKEMFAFFQQRVKNYLGAGECEFLKKEPEPAGFADAIVLPLTIQRDNIGYLAARGIKKEGLEKFHILAQQFLVGLKRALLYQEVQKLSITDSLTNAFSRRRFLEKAREELERSEEHT